MLVSGIQQSDSVIQYVCVYTKKLGWPNSSFRFFRSILWKNSNELFGQPNSTSVSPCKTLTSTSMWVNHEVWPHYNMFCITLNVFDWTVWIINGSEPRPRGATMLNGYLHCGAEMVNSILFNRHVKGLKKNCIRYIRI